VLFAEFQRCIDLKMHWALAFNFK